MNSIFNRKLKLHQIVKISLFSILLFLLITEFIIFPPVITYLVSGISMEPSLHDGQRIYLLANYVSNNYQRGDIVIFVFTQNKEQSRTLPDGRIRKRKIAWERTFVKRIFGLPGDSVLIRDGVIYVNYQPVQKTYSLEPPKEDYGPVIVDAGHYFVLGDNINISMDSRDPEIGMVAKEQILGKIIFK